MDDPADIDWERRWACWLVWDITSVGIRMDVKEMMIIQQRTHRATHEIFRNMFLS